MTACALCQNISSRELEPCPNNPPCKPYQHPCNYLLTDCSHKTEADEFEEFIESRKQIKGWSDYIECCDTGDHEVIFKAVTVYGMDQPIYRAYCGEYEYDFFWTAEKVFELV